MGRWGGLKGFDQPITLSHPTLARLSWAVTICNCPYSLSRSEYASGSHVSPLWFLQILNMTLTYAEKFKFYLGQKTEWRSTLIIYNLTQTPKGEGECQTGSKVLHCLLDEHVPIMSDFLFISSTGALVNF